MTFVDTYIGTYIAKKDRLPKDLLELKDTVIIRTIMGNNPMTRAFRHR